MSPAEFELQPSDVPQPQLLDEDPVTDKWPMPPVRPWNPQPRASWWERLRAWAAECRDPLDMEGL
jgi:hypothetical protein